MRRAHAFLLPSLYEEWGYVAVESILSGTPVVAYPVYPFADMLAGGLGAVAGAMTVTAFAAAVATVVDGTGVTSRGPALAAAGARRFGPAAVGARLTTIWDEHPHGNP
jgi:glycosyltransferase involved in cell wall biosynthesis